MILVFLRTDVDHATIVEQFIFRISFIPVELYSLTTVGLKPPTVLFYVIVTREKPANFLPIFRPTFGKVHLIRSLNDFLHGPDLGGYSHPPPHFVTECFGILVPGQHFEWNIFLVRSGLVTDLSSG